jgi:hypothetical protein
MSNKILDTRTILDAVVASDITVAVMVYEEMVDELPALAEAFINDKGVASVANMSEEMQLFSINHYFKTICYTLSGATGKNTIQLRRFLVDNTTLDAWLDLFKNHTIKELKKISLDLQKETK